MKEMERLLEVVEKLRAPDGCPWDREQTHSSLKAACVEDQYTGGDRQCGKP